MKTSFKKDEIREKSISLRKNAFFYLEILMLIILFASSWTLFSMSSTLKSDERFKAYNGKNMTNQNMNPSANLNSHEDEIDYRNITVVVPERKKYNKINKGCQLGIASSIFAEVFLIFLIYMCIRVARENKKKYQTKENAKKVGLNICHFMVFILLTLLCFILAFVTEIYIAIALSQKTYCVFHDMIRNQLITNSLILVCYILIILFYCKI